MRLSNDKLRQLVAEGRLPVSVLPKSGKPAGLSRKRKSPPVCQPTPGLEAKLETVPGGIRITYPFPLPSRNTEGEGSRHWRVATRRNRQVKEAVLRCLRILQPPAFEAPVILIYTAFTPLGRDANNTNDKYATDALVACGVLPDDGRAHVVEVRYRSEPGPPHTELLILEAGHARA